MGGNLLSSTWGLGELRWGRVPAGVWSGVGKALNPAERWDGIIPAGGGQGMGYCGVPALASSRQRASCGAQEVPQLEMGFSWCRWRWAWIQGISREMNQWANPKPGAQR